MIFLTIGTLFEFDRLVKAVDKAVEKGLIEDQVFAQVGPGIYKPSNMTFVDSLSKEDYDNKVRTCDAMISHAGMGSISMAINCKKPLLVMPRLKKFKEHVNDHQLGSARKFESLGHILAAYDENELAEKIVMLRDFVPKQRTPNQQGVIDRIESYLKQIQETKI